MIQDLTQTSKKDAPSITLPKSSISPGMAKIKEKAAEKRAQSDLGKSRSVVSRAREGKKKGRQKAQNLAPYIDFLPMDGGIVISKLDYVLEEETDDSYIFKKMELGKQKEIESKAVHISKLISKKQGRLD